MAESAQLTSRRAKWPDSVLWSICALGFSSGLPLAFLGSTLLAWYSVSGVNLMAMGWLSLIGQPYIYKVFWAPFLDYFKPRWLGRRRGWIIVMQAGLALSLFIMALMSPKSQPLGLALVALCAAVLSATQDIAIDAYRTEILAPKQRGIGAAFTTAGYRLAMLVAGGLALVLAAQVGWHVMYGLLALLMLFMMCLTPLAKAVPDEARARRGIREAVIEPFSDLNNRFSRIGVVLAFIVLYKLSDAFAMTLTTPFLLRDMGFSLAEVGVVYKVFGFSSILLGSILGGVWLPRLGTQRGLWYFGIAQGLGNLGFLALALVGKYYGLLVTAVLIEGLTSGLGTVVLVAFLMGLCQPRYAATQFAVLSALISIGRVFLGPIAGVVAYRAGWVSYYALSIGLMVPGLWLLYYLKGAKLWQQISM